MRKCKLLFVKTVKVGAWFLPQQHF
jgi:hypothetical protein